jgi:ABC-type phosphate transport system substrate-binding protein
VLVLLGSALLFLVVNPGASGPSAGGTGLFGTPLEPLAAAFFDLVLSREGQDLVAEEGYVPLSPEQVEEWREKLGLRAPER